MDGPSGDGSDDRDDRERWSHDDHDRWSRVGAGEDEPGERAGEDEPGERAGEDEPGERAGKDGFSGFDDAGRDARDADGGSPLRAEDPGPGPDAGASDDSTAPLSVDWGPRADDVTNVERLWAVLVAVGLGVTGFVVAFFVFQVAAIGLLLAGIDVGELSFAGNLILTFVVLQGTAFPLVALGYLGYRGVSLSYLRVRVPDLWDLAWVVGGFLLVFALVTAVIVAVSLADAPQAERSDTEQFRENPDAILLMIPVSILLIGPAEELLFRGVIQTRLRETFGPVGAVVFANFAFAPLHVFALTGSLTAIAVTIGGLFVPGLVFGAVYELTDNLAVPALIHGLYNAVIFGSFYLSATALLA